MSASKIFTLFTLLLLASGSVYAESYRCVGMDGEGEKVNVLYDEGTSTVNVNGTVLKIESSTNANNGIATENYKLENGKEVYVSLVVEDKSKIILRQFSAKDDEELAVVPLACE